EHRIGERVRFVGMSDRVPDYLRAADAFFLPSLGEGMSNALLEAMACGLPCVVTEAVGGIDELLGRDRGVAVPVQDVHAWADAMRRLADDPARRAELGSAAARYVGSTLSIDATADRLADLYRELAMHP
ncbi:MAG: glycosyltransferase, partial [Acidimicrobiia bacterium]